MTQARNLRSYGESLTTELMTTRAVKQGEILNFGGPDGVGHSPSGPNRPREPGRACFAATATLRGSNLAPLWSAVGGKKEV